MRARSIALFALPLAAVALLVAGIWARRAPDEADALGTLLAAGGVGGAPSVNVPAAQPVNPPPPPVRVESARDFVARLHSELLALVRQGAPAESIALRVGAAIDAVDVTRRALGLPCPLMAPRCTNHWDSLTDEQQAQTTELVGSLVEKNLRTKLASAVRREVAYVGTTDLGNGLSRVRTSSEGVQVDYVLVKTKDHWMFVDVITEGSSMTKNYYDQFHLMLEAPDKGYPFMVKKLEKKIRSS